MLVGGLLVLPIALVLVLGVASLLGGMGDELGALVLRRIALGLGIVWALVGVCLVALLGIQSLATTDREPNSPLTRPNNTDLRNKRPAWRPDNMFKVSCRVHFGMPKRAIPAIFRIMLPGTPNSI